MAELADIRAELTAVAERFDASGLLGSQAAAVVADATAIINAAATIRMLAAGRVADTPAWRLRGHRSAADWLAAQTKSSVGEARSALGAAGQLAACPAVAAKARAGALSAAQTEALAGAVAVDPTAEDRLLGVAARDGLGKLKDACRAVALSGDDADARHARIHRERSLRHWTDQEGAFRLAGQLTPEAGATVLGALAPFEKAAFHHARRDGRHEPHEAYLADALVDLARASLADDTARHGTDSSSDTQDQRETGRDRAPTDSTLAKGRAKRSKPVSRKPSFTVLVDLEALLRGHAEPGETCEIPGIGPIPVARLYDLAPEAFWHVLVTNGRDIRSYCAMTRYIPTMLKVALAARDRECAVVGCNRTEGLEIDHITPVEDHGPTTYTNLERKCFHDHRDNKHRRGMALDTDDRAPP
jgi:hypothetical protein